MNVFIIQVMVFVINVNSNFILNLQINVSKPVHLIA